MGQTLSEPLTTKHSATCANAKFKVGSSCMQGWRVTMEDAHSHILELPEDKDASYFAVYDGHGGSVISKHAASNLHSFILQRPEYKDGDIPTAFKKAFLEFDDSMLNDDKLKNEISGTTAVTCLIKGNKLYCGNVGDSRAVACINGKCHPLSFDHKPTNPAEESRIRQAGGWVEFNRVNGNLALSRALGDFSFKRNVNKTPEEQMVCALPDVEERMITEDWDFIILACDGIWDVISNEEACELVRYPLGNGIEPDKVCEEVIQTCLAPDSQMGGIGCDNMTMVLICLLNGQSWGSYCSKIASGLDTSVLGYGRSRLHQSSATDYGSSGDDDDDVIPPEKMGEARSIAASMLCTSLRDRESLLTHKTGEETVVNDSEQHEELELQTVMEAKDYVYKGNAVAGDKGEPGEDPVASINSVPSGTDLVGGINTEVLAPNRNSADKGKSNNKQAK